MQVIFPNLLTKLIGSSILIFMGLYISFKSLQEKGTKYNIFNDPISSDLDNSKIIDSYESLFLAVALSLDSFCIGIGGSISNINLRFFPLLVSIFQVLFLVAGRYLGVRINKICRFPQNIWSIISGILLIFIGFIKLFSF